MKYTLAILISLGGATFALAAAPSTRPQSSPPPPPPPPQQQQQQQQQQPQQSARSARPASYADRYSILTQRNIFLRDRSRGSRNGSTTGPTTSTASTQPARRPPEETLLLRGIVVEQGEVRAYFEDVEDARIVRVAEGDTIARGRIVSIGLDAVEYEPTVTSGGGGGGGQQPRRTFVVVGNDLTGKISALDGATSSSAAAMATTGPVMPSGLEGLNPNDPNLTAEQKMKLRRAMELKK